jgi:hypothetical protein
MRFNFFRCLLRDVFESEAGDSCWWRLVGKKVLLGTDFLVDEASNCTQDTNRLTNISCQSFNRPQQALRLITLDIRASSSAVTYILITYKHSDYLFTLVVGAGLVQSVYCLATGWTTRRSGFDSRRGQRFFPSILCVQTGSGAQPASCTMGTGGPFPGGKSAAGA